ncbi:MAG: hypothetical protein WA268_04525 [Xanthobacteraceae bacterium]
MKVFKYLCAIAALAYLANAFFPMPPGAPQVVPAWVGRAALAVNCLLLGTISFGIQIRKPIYWKFIPVLMAIYLLWNFIVPLFDLISLSLPWLPFVSIIVFAVIGFLVFMAWWRNQKYYFAGWIAQLT